MNDLPQDLVREILSRVPATSLRQLRSTCKQWDDALTDPEFIKKQFRKSAAAKQCMVLGMVKQDGVKLVNITSTLLGIDDPSTEFTSTLITLKDSYNGTGESGIIEIFYCDGLLLCTIFDKSIPLRLIGIVVWNPCLGQTRWIEPRDSYDICDMFALGYDSNSKYKILRNYDCYCRKKRNMFEIYDCSFNSWKHLDEDAVSDDWSELLQRCVSLNGNAYRGGFTRVSGDGPMLIRFDFSTETFQRLCLPPSLQGLHFSENDIYMSLSVVRGEQLLLLHQSTRTLKTEIWVTTNDNKIDQTKVLSWSNFFTVDLRTHGLQGISFEHEISFFIMDEEKKIIFCCDTSLGYIHAYIIGEEENGFREFLLEHHNHFSCEPLLFSYVPSLVQIPNGSAGGETEKQIVSKILASCWISF